MSIGVPDNIKNMYIGGNVPGTTYVENPDGEVTISGTGYVTSTGILLQKTADNGTSISLNNGQSLTATYTLSNNAGKRLFAIPAVSIFEDEISAAGIIPNGSNIGASDYLFSSWIDTAEDDNNNIVFKVYVLNQSGGTHTIYVYASFRYLVDQGGVE